MRAPSTCAFRYSEIGRCETAKCGLEVPEPKRLFARCVDLLAGELGIDRERILGWGMAQAVLSAWWSIEDHGYGWEPAVTCAEILASLM